MFGNLVKVINASVISFSSGDAPKYGFGNALTFSRSDFAVSTEYVGAEGAVISNTSLTVFG